MRLATLHELDTVYGVRDLYMMLEVVQVDRHNDWLATEWAKQQHE
ncbi:MAG TPA: hypothetical protein VGF65_11310 [Mycobacterium sp.]